QTTMQACGYKERSPKLILAWNLDKLLTVRASNPTWIPHRTSVYQRRWLKSLHQYVTRSAERPIPSPHPSNLASDSGGGVHGRGPRIGGCFTTRPCSSRNRRRPLSAATPGARTATLNTRLGHKSHGRRSACALRALSARNNRRRTAPDQ